MFSPLACLRVCLSCDCHANCDYPRSRSLWSKRYHSFNTPIPIPLSFPISAISVLHSTVYGVPGRILRQKAHTFHIVLLCFTAAVKKNAIKERRIRSLRITLGKKFKYKGKVSLNCSSHFRDIHFPKTNNLSNNHLTIVPRVNYSSVNIYVLRTKYV